MATHDHSEVFMTDNIVSMVEGTYGMLDREWFQQFKKTYPPVGYRRDMKTVRILLPRRSGISTAAKQLWDAHPNSLLYFATHFERDHFVTQFRLQKNEDRVRVIPQTIHDVISMDGRLPHAKLHRDLVIFDGISRMKHSLVEEVCGFHDPFTKLFVLLG